MRFVIDVKELVPRGYKFQKLFAFNYKCYHKRFKSGHTLWLWVKGMTIELNDWYDNTENIIKFYIENLNHPDFDKFSPSNNGPRNYIKVQMNPENGFVQMYDYESYYAVLRSESWNKWEEKYKGWHNEIILYKDSMKELIDEINYLTGRDLWNEFAIKSSN